MFDVELLFRDVTGFDLRKQMGPVEISPVHLLASLLLCHRESLDSLKREA